jgi:DNA ligase-1
MILDKLNKLVDELNETTSSNDKKDILKKGADKEIQSLFKLIYGNIDFGITSDGLKKGAKVADVSHRDNDDDIESIMKKLHARKYTGYDAVAFVNNYISRHEKYRDLIYNIIDKNLKCRIDTSLINKVFPNLIPEFEVALANDYFKRKDVNFDKDVWYASHKLDGCRNLTIIDEDGVVTCFSRNGKEFKTLDVLKKHIEKLGLKSIVLDGEICIVNEKDEEDFQSVMKQITRKDFTIEKPRYKIFDMLTLEEFYAKSSERILSERIKTLKATIMPDKILDVLEQTEIKDKDHFEQLFGLAIEKLWEGLIVRKNVGYEGKRSNNMLKCKKFSDAEYKVVGVENGKIRNIINGKEVEEMMLSKVIISHKGNDVGVGSGFSIDQRKEFYKNPKLIVGKTITVKFFEETKNEDGKYSLRFPVLKILHGDKRDS